MRLSYILIVQQIEVIRFIPLYKDQLTFQPNELVEIKYFTKSTFLDEFLGS